MVVILFGLVLCSFVLKYIHTYTDENNYSQWIAETKEDFQEERYIYKKDVPCKRTPPKGKRP